MRFVHTTDRRTIERAKHLGLRIEKGNRDWLIPVPEQKETIQYLLKKTKEGNYGI